MLRKVSTHEPVTQLRKVPIVECGEPLVNYLELNPKLLVGAGGPSTRRVLREF